MVHWTPLGGSWYTVRSTSPARFGPHLSLYLVGFLPTERPRRILRQQTPPSGVATKVCHDELEGGLGRIQGWLAQLAQLGSFILRPFSQISLQLSPPHGLLTHTLLETLLNRPRRSLPCPTHHPPMSQRPTTARPLQMATSRSGTFGLTACPRAGGRGRSFQRRRSVVFWDWRTAPAPRTPLRGRCTNTGHLLEGPGMGGGPG